MGCSEKELDMITIQTNILMIIIACEFASALATVLLKVMAVGCSGIMGIDGNGGGCIDGGCS